MTLVMVDAYLQPLEMLGLQWPSPLPPTPRSSFWSLLLFPLEGASRSKTGAANDTVVLNSPRLAWAGPLLSALLRGPPSERLLAQEYADYYQPFITVTTKLRLSVVPS